MTALSDLGPWGDAASAPGSIGSDVDPVDQRHVAVPARDHGPVDLRLLLTKDEAAAALRMSVRQLSRWVASGDLAPVRLGGQVRFTVRELHDFIDRHATRPNRPAGQRNSRMRGRR